MVIKEALLEAEKILKVAGIEDAHFEVKCLIKDVFKKDPLSDEDFLEAEKLFALAHRRALGYPLQYLIGEWDFYDITLYIGEGVLIPRSDTETLVDKALEILEKKENPYVLDLCSGSGAIPLVLSRKKEGKYFAVEKEDSAYGYLNKNNERYGNSIKLYKADALDKSFISSLERFDIITANPPYLTKEDMDSLQKEVEYEPSTALYGGEDGLFFYKKISSLYFSKLKPNGALVFEIGYSQGEKVSKILKEAGYRDISVSKDLNNLDRVVIGYKR